MTYLFRRKVTKPTYTTDHFRRKLVPTDGPCPRMDHHLNLKQIRSKILMHMNVMLFLSMKHICIYQITFNYFQSTCENAEARRSLVTLLGAFTRNRVHSRPHPLGESTSRPRLWLTVRCHHRSIDRFTLTEWG